MTYKGMMLEGVPNLAFTIGYTNASWTLKCDLTCEYVCRLHQPHGRARLRVRRSAQRRPRDRAEEPMIDFNSGYVLRSIDEFPKQGSKAAVAAAPELRARRPLLCGGRASTTACSSSRVAERTSCPLSRMLKLRTR